MAYKRRKPMTYKDAFVVEVKCKGKILRMRDDFVSLPFGSEYSIYLKNLNSRKAAVNISIDGEDVLDYSSLILEPNSSTELKGFLRGIVARNGFKFIQKTKEIQDHRGDRVDDGIIRVEFAYEKAAPIRKKTIITEEHHHHTDHYHWNYDNWFSGDSTIKYGSGGVRGLADNVVTYTSSGGPIQTFHSNVSMDSLGVVSASIGTGETVNMSYSQPVSDEGITVKGSEVNQQFQYSSIGALDPSEVIIIRMKGHTPTHEPLQTPITVQTKLTCSSCGRSYKSSFKYCSNCGTYLE